MVDLPFIENEKNFFSRMRVYLFGRGLLSLGVMAAGMTTALLGGPLAIPALVIAVGGATLSAVNQLYAQRLYEQDMIALYRDDIASHLRIAPESVTRAHLKIAAENNEIIAQALTRQRRKNIVGFATTALAATVTLGILLLGLPAGADSMASNHIAQSITDFFSRTFGKTAASFLQYLSVGIISGTSSLLLNDGLRLAIGAGTGLSKAAAHDLIVTMVHDVRRGHVISPEQVYGVLVAGDHALQKVIHDQFGKSYASMNNLERSAVLMRISVAEEMKSLAVSINRGQVPPGHLAYMICDARCAPRSIEKPQRAPAMEPVLQPVRSDFVERLGLAPRAQAASFADRVEGSRAAGIPAQAI